MSFFFQSGTKPCGCAGRVNDLERRISDLEDELKKANNRISGVGIAAGLTPRPKTGKTE